MDLFRGLGKAGTGILGGVVHGAGKIVETAGDVAGKTPVVGGVVGRVVSGTGRAIETVGEATEDIGDALFGKKEGKKKADDDAAKAAPVDVEESVEKVEEDYEPFFSDYPQVFVSLDGEDDRSYYDDSLDDLMKYDAEQARLMKEAADGGGDDKMDEA